MPSSRLGVTGDGRRLLRYGLAVAAVIAVLASATWELSWRALEREAGPTTIPAARETGSDFALTIHDRPRDLPELRFADSEGHALSLAEFRGRPVLLNIWATWCVPCREEMPALDRLQAKLGSALLVLPLSIDRQGAPQVERFYRELGLENLAIYVDEPGSAPRVLGSPGVPTTLLLDRDGREIGRKLGPAEWDSPDMLVVLDRHLGLAHE